MKKEIIKPFDLAKAKAGAKLRTKNGCPVEILKWDAKGEYPIKGLHLINNEEWTDDWDITGECLTGFDNELDLVIVEEVEEPKFKAGDVITNGKCVYKIVRVTDNCYNFENFRGACVVGTIDDTDENYHLWNFDDAKAGDVLADGNFPFIFKKIDTNRYSYAYCGISAYNDFKIKSDWKSGEWTWMQDIKPATKEQRDLLFRKMHEAGYEWDAEKLELKKVKQKFWSDNKNSTIGGFFIDMSADIEEAVKVHNTETNYDVFATKKQAKSALAMARISQIMANDIENFGGVITDEEWNNDEPKFIIYRYGSCIRTTSPIVNVYNFLAFHTAEQRNLFLEKYPQLVKDYLMIPDEETK